MQSIINKFYGFTPSTTASSFQPHSISSLKVYPSNSVFTSNIPKTRTPYSLPLSREIPVSKAVAVPYLQKVSPKPPTKDNTDKLKLTNLEKKLTTIENLLIENKNENDEAQKSLQEKLTQAQKESQILSDNYKRLQQDYLQMRNLYNHQQYYNVPYYQPVPIEIHKGNYYEGYKGNVNRRNIVQKQLQEARWKLRDHYGYYEEETEELEDEDDNERQDDNKIMLKGRKGMKRRKRRKPLDTSGDEDNDDDNEEIETCEGIPHHVASDLQKRNHRINEQLNGIKNDFRNIREDINSRLSDIEQQHINNQQDLVKIIEQGGNEKLKKSFKRYYLDKTEEEDENGEGDNIEESEEDEPPDEIARLPQLIDQHIANKYKEMELQKRRAEAERRQMEKENTFQLPVIENQNMMNASQAQSMNHSRMRSFYRKETNTSHIIRNKSAFDKEFHHIKEKKMKLMNNNNDEHDDEDNETFNKKKKDRRRKGIKDYDEEEKESDINKKKSKKKKQKKKAQLRNEEENNEDNEEREISVKKSKKKKKRKNRN